MSTQPKPEPKGELAVVYPWERQAEDTDRAFEAFEVYRTLGQSRTYKKVAEKLKKSDTIVKRWAHRDNWDVRVQAYDRYEARVITQRIIAGTASMRERQIALAMQMQSRASNRILRMSQPEIDAMDISDVCSLMKAASEIERKAREVNESELGGDATMLPKFELRFYSPGPSMVAAHTADGRYGWIPDDMIDEFRERFPGAVVIC